MTIVLPGARIEVSTCARCGSENVDGIDVQRVDGEWVMVAGPAWCHACKAQTSIVWKPIEPETPR